MGSWQGEALSCSGAGSDGPTVLGQVMAAGHRGEPGSSLEAELDPSPWCLPKPIPSQGSGVTSGGSQLSWDWRISPEAKLSILKTRRVLGTAGQLDT